MEMRSLSGSTQEMLTLIKKKLQVILQVWSELNNYYYSTTHFPAENKVMIDCQLAGLDRII